MFAFIKHSGKQFKVTEGSIITVDKVAASEGEELAIENICLLIKDEGVLEVNPKGKVICKVLQHTRSKKVLVFKQRPKKGYRRKKSHRRQEVKLLVKKLEIA